MKWSLDPGARLGFVIEVVIVLIGVFVVGVGLMILG